MSVNYVHFVVVEPLTDYILPADNDAEQDLHGRRTTSYSKVRVERSFM